jgi:hypothetical protein
MAAAGSAAVDRPVNFPDKTTIEASALRPEDIWGKEAPMGALAGIVLLLLSYASATAQERCNQDRARQDMQRLTDNGTIVSVGQFAPYVTVVVDEKRWRRIDNDTRRTMAQTIDCATVGANTQMLRIVTFRSAADNQPLGSFSGPDLKAK